MNRTGRCLATLILLPLLLFQAVLCADELDRDAAGLRSFFDDVLGSGTAVQAGRTFGHKRIQFMMMPMVYKMGVMMTMLMVLTVISLKGLMIGLVLLVLKLSAIFGKFYATFHGHGGHSGWQPPQPVHVHVHPDPIHTHSHLSSHSQAYSGWEGNGGGGPPPDESYYYKG